MEINYKESAIILLGLILIVLIYYFIDKTLSKNRRQKLSNRPIFYTEEVKQKKQATPHALQAYERLIILLERIDLPKLLTRVQPISNLKQDYTTFLIQNIEQEFDFNLSQQLYVSEESWALVLTAKNTVIQEILKTSLDNNIPDAENLRISILNKKDHNSVVDIAKNRLKKEVSEMI